MLNLNFKNAGTTLKKMIETDTSTKIISIVVAIVIWFAISVSVYPTITKTLYSVPVKIDFTGTYAEANSLSAASLSEESANVYITGERSQIGNLSADEDITLTVDTSSITSAGSYRLPLEISNSSGKTFDVNKIDPAFVTIEVEKIITKDFNVTAKLDSSINIADGFMSKEPIIVSDDTISVTGPENQINSITDVVVTVSSAEPVTLSSSYEFTTSNIVLYNNSVIISDTDGSIRYNKTNFTVQIPVYARQTLPLEVSVVNAPDGFDIDSFKKQLVLSATELDIAAPTDKIKDITSINIGTINMREVDIGSTFTFNIENILPEGYENLSGLNAVTVTCPSEGLSKKLVAIRGNTIQIINKPSQFDFELITSTLMPYFIGPEDKIDDLTSTDITCQIDMLNTDFNNQEGDFILPVTFTINNSSDIWINAGSASLNVYVQAKAKN